MLDAAGSDESVADLLDILSLPPQDQNFEAVLFIQMDVRGGKDGLIKAVLQVRQDPGEFPGVMVVNYSQRAHGLLTPALPFFLDQIIADQIPKSFRAVPVPLSGNQLIKVFKQGSIHRNPKPRNASHFSLPNPGR